MIAGTTRVLKNNLVSGPPNSRHSIVITMASAGFEHHGKNHAVHTFHSTFLPQRITRTSITLPPDHDSFSRISLGLQSANISVSTGVRFLQLNVDA